MKKQLVSFALLLLFVTQTKGQKPVANFSASSDSVCPDVGIVNFTDQSTNNPTSWQWSFQGDYPSSSSEQNPQNIYFFSPGNDTIKLIVSNSNGVDSISKTVFVYPYTPTPNIILTHDTMFCSFDSSYASYQWYKNDTLIVGATKPFFVIGIYPCENYNVQVCDVHGCCIAVGINIICEGINKLIDEREITISPNPATNQLTIQASSLNRDKPANVFITNMLGQMLYQSAFTNQQSEIDISFLHAGIYFLQMKMESGVATKKFVKE